MKQNTWVKLLIFAIIIVIVVGVAITLLVCKFMPNDSKDKDGLVEFSVDPIIYNSTGEVSSHVIGAERFTLDLQRNIDKDTRTVDVDISNGQYLCYAYTINNIGSTDVNWTITLSDELQNAGFTVSYKIDEGQETPAGESEIVSGQIKVEQKQNVYVYFRADADGASIEGKLIVSLSKV